MENFKTVINTIIAIVVLIVVLVVFQYLAFSGGVIQMVAVVGLIMMIFKNLHDNGVIDLK